MENRVKNLGEAVHVLIQVAQMAQSKGILSLEDAVITKSAIDFFEELRKSSNSSEGSSKDPE